jgi:hypothetical protein
MMQINGQNVQPFIGNSDVSIGVKYSKQVETQSNNQSLIARQFAICLGFLYTASPSVIVDYHVNILTYSLHLDFCTIIINS